MQIVINRCHGGFGLSEEAYEKLIEWGVPVKKYVEGEDDGGNSEVIFDRELTPPGESMWGDIYWRYKGKTTLNSRYWDTWTRESRTHPLVIRVVEELGEKASGRCAELKIIDIPDGVQYSIAEYDGLEHVAETHRTWG